MSITSTKSKVIKVIYETDPFDNKTLPQQIETQFKLLNFMKDGYSIEHESSPNSIWYTNLASGWFPKLTTCFSVDSVKYRVLEKPKEIETYTITYLSSRGEVTVWGTTDKERFYNEVKGSGEICSVLLKIHVDKVYI